MPTLGRFLWPLNRVKSFTSSNPRRARAYLWLQCPIVLEVMPCHDWVMAYHFFIPVLLVGLCRSGGFRIAGELPVKGREVGPRPYTN